jgi:hypothetical protein
VNLFENVMWYSVLPSVSFSFLRLHLSMSNIRIAHLLIVSHSLPFCNNQISITVHSPEGWTWRTLKFHFPSIKLCSIWIRIFKPSDAEVNLWMLRYGSIVLFTVRLLDVANFTTLTPLSLQILSRLLFPIVVLKLYLLGIKILNRIFMWCLGNLSDMF